MEEIRPLKLRATPRALAHLAAIERYIAKDRPNAAKQVGARISSSFQFLRDFPGMGHAGRRKNTLEWVVPGLPYAIVYRVRSGMLEVLGVYHGARQNRT